MRLDKNFFAHGIKRIINVKKSANYNQIGINSLEDSVKSSKNQLLTLEIEENTQILSAVQTKAELIMPKQKEPIYKITFINKGQIYEVFAKQVYTSDLYGFVEIEDYLFGEKTQVVVDPSEEKLKAEFHDVKRSFIPMQAIIRIDEVEKEGVSKIENGDNIAPFPTLISPQGSRGEN